MRFLKSLRTPRLLFYPSWTCWTLNEHTLLCKFCSSTHSNMIIDRTIFELLLLVVMDWIINNLDLHMMTLWPQRLSHMIFSMFPQWFSSFCIIKFNRALWFTRVTRNINKCFFNIFLMSSSSSIMPRCKKKFLNVETNASATTI